MSDKTNVCLLRELIHRFSEKTDTKIKICSNLIPAGRFIPPHPDLPSLHTNQNHRIRYASVYPPHSINCSIFPPPGGVLYFFSQFYIRRETGRSTCKRLQLLFFFLFSSCFRVSAVETYLSAAITIKPSGEAGRCRASGHI